MSVAPPPPPEFELLPSAVNPVARQQLIAYADFLADAGVVRGLIGPREVDRLWSRHVLNCAVAAELIPAEAEVVDVGSGAGLPGIVWAIVRPDIRLTCIEPLQRRTTFLEEAVARLGMSDRVAVVRARAEEVPRSGAAIRGDVVTARAVAPLEKLATWTVPLVRPGGELLALKGQSAAEEVAVAAPVLQRLGIDHVDIVQCGSGVVDPLTTVVRARKQS